MDLSQLVYSPIIRPIRKQYVEQIKVSKFNFRDKGKKISKIKI
jgi:hypothetical protein